MFLKLLGVLTDLVYLLLELQVVVTLVPCPLPLETPDALLDVSFNHLELVGRQFFGSLDLSVYLFMDALVLHLVVVFNLPDLGLEYLVCFLDLEVSNLGYQWLDFFPDLLDQLSSLTRVKSSVL